MLDIADGKGQILKDIIIVPFANPIGTHPYSHRFDIYHFAVGLSQQLLGSSLGKMAFESGSEFSSNWNDLSSQV